MLDREAVGGLELALKRAHDPGGDRAVEAEGVADCDHGIPHLDLARVAERQRVQVLRVRAHLQEGDVGARVPPDDLGVERLVAEADRHLGRALDDVCVGEDVAVLVDHEAGASRLSALALRKAEDRLTALNDLGAHECDARSGLLVDLVHGEARLALVAGVCGRLRDRTLDDRRLVLADSACRDQDHAEDQDGETAQQSRDERVLDGIAQALADRGAGSE